MTIKAWILHKSRLRENHQSDILLLRAAPQGAKSQQCAIIRRKPKKLARKSLAVRARGKGDWIVIDALDVVVHLFRPEVRDFYGLEKMWTQDAADEVLTVGADG